MLTALNKRILSSRTMWRKFPADEDIDVRDGRYGNVEHVVLEAAPQYPASLIACPQGQGLTGYRQNLGAQVQDVGVEIANWIRRWEYLGGGELRDHRAKAPLAEILHEPGGQRSNSASKHPLSTEVST